MTLDICALHIHFISQLLYTWAGHIVTIDWICSILKLHVYRSYRPRGFVDAGFRPCMHSIVWSVPLTPKLLFDYHLFEWTGVDIRWFSVNGFDTRWIPSSFSWVTVSTVHSNCATRDCILHLLYTQTARIQTIYCSLDMGWLRSVGSLKLQVSFADCSLFYRALLQKKPIIVRSLLIEATPYMYCTLKLRI